MLEINETYASDIVRLRLSGIVTSYEVEQAIPQLDRLFSERKPLKLLVELLGLESIEPMAAWEELSFLARHRDETARVALIVETPGERTVARITEFFTGGEHREFHHGEEAQARAWLRAGP